MDPIKVYIHLDNIHCFNVLNPNLPPNPYLWTVFFKIDGETAFVDVVDGNHKKLQGTATVVGTPGNHGNLLRADVGAGEVISIPYTLGFFRTLLTPISLRIPDLGSLPGIVPGIVGCIAILMEEDGTPNSAIAAGHNILNTAVQTCLNDIIPTFKFATEEDEEINIDEEINTFVEDLKIKIASAVENEIRRNVDIWDWLVASGDMDDQIGVEVFTFLQNELIDAGSFPLSKRWTNLLDDWEIRGHISTGPTWLPLGGKILADPALASWSADRLDIIVRGADDGVYHKAWDGANWSATWESLGGRITDKPTVVSWGPNRLDIFVRAPNGGIFHKAWDGSHWSPEESDEWEPLGAESGNHAPAVVSRAPGRLDVFTSDPNRVGVIHKAWLGSNWSDWESLGGSNDFIGSGPVVTSWGPDRLDLFFCGIKGAVYHKAWDNGQWFPERTGDWESIGGPPHPTSMLPDAVGIPAVVSWGPNRLDIFVADSRGQIFHKAWDGSRWFPSQIDWEPLGGIATSTPVVTSWGENRLDIFVRGADGGIFHKAWDGVAWYPSQMFWEPLGGLIEGTPAVVSWGVTRLDILGRGIDGQVFQKAWDNTLGWWP